MPYDSEQLEREKESILARLFKTKTKGWGRITDPAERQDAHRLGTIEKLLAKLRS
jgi:hypothetical protein